MLRIDEHGVVDSPEQFDSTRAINLVGDWWTPRIKSAWLTWAEVGFGSLAAIQNSIIPVSAFGGKADIDWVNTLKKKAGPMNGTGLFSW